MEPFDFYEQMLGVDSAKAVLIGELIGKIVGGVRRGLTSESVDEDHADRIVQMLWSQTIGSVIQTMEKLQGGVVAAMPIPMTPSEILGDETAVSIVTNAMALSGPLDSADVTATKIVAALDKLIERKRKP